MMIMVWKKITIYGYTDNDGMGNLSLQDLKRVVMREAKGGEVLKKGRDVLGKHRGLLGDSRRRIGKGPEMPGGTYFLRLRMTVCPSGRGSSLGWR